jgi:hypothetical protein
MRKHLPLVVLLSTLAAIPALAAPPASAPAASLPPAKYDTPEEAMRSYIRARFAKDAARTREAIDIPAARKADVDAAVEAMIASDTLQKEAAAHFGVEGRKVFDPDYAGRLAATLEALDKSQVKVEGDRATVIDPEGAASAVLIKTPAGWKIDGMSLLGTGDASETARRVELFRKAAGVSATIQSGIAANKYLVANDAYRDYVKLMGQAAKEGTSPESTTATAPAVSAPASRP